jgi:hypothetical protein
MESVLDADLSSNLVGGLVLDAPETDEEGELFVEAGAVRCGQGNCFSPNFSWGVPMCT